MITSELLALCTSTTRLLLYFLVNEGFKSRKVTRSYHEYHVGAKVALRFAVNQLLSFHLPKRFDYPLLHFQQNFGALTHREKGGWQIDR